MNVERNVGGLDRALRAVIGVVLLAVAIDAAIDGRRAVSVGLTAVSVGLLVNVLTRFCGLNAVLGIDTCPSTA